jgi:FkbM family methyltransferase
MELKIHDKPPTVCLNMIVKNEEHIIKETLEMLCNKIKFSYWVICDTGSTDNTKEIICNFFKEKEIYGEIFDHQWKNFAHNRTLALDMAFNKSDLLFIFDADDEIHGNIVIPNIIDNDGYLLNFGTSEGISYQRILLVNNRIKWNYQSVIHEYINCLKPNANITTLKGDYYVVSGRRGSRNQDPNKYLKDAKILEEAYHEAKSNNDSLYLRYGFYCANSYKDAGMSNESIKWYKITLNNDNWIQEKYMSCLNLYYEYNRIDEKEKGFYYLVESLKYDTERMECVYYLVNHYLLNDLPYLAYNYYSLIKDFYENRYLNSSNEGKLFIEVDKANLLLPYYMILLADKVKDKFVEANKTIIKMYEIIFTKKYPSNQDFLIGNLLYNLQFFIDLCMSSDGFKELFQSYIDFLQNKLKYNLVKHDFLKKYTKYGLNFECFNISISSFTLDECKKSNKILFYTGFANLPWNYTYSLNNALGGSETAVANLSKAFPNNFEIYVCGSVAEEKFDNIKYVHLNNIRELVKNTPFHSVIVSRYIGFYEMFPETSFYQSYIWGHDICIYNYGCDLDVSSILKKWNSKITGCICQTEWHKNLFILQYPELKDKIFTINNGILTDKFIDKTVKFTNRFIYTSCAERGLDRLIELWPSIIEILPDAELFIASYNKFPQNDHERQLENIINKYDSIKHVGCLNKDKLYELMSSAEFWLYPTNFQETSCITSMEMLMSEVICIYYPIAGLNNTLGDYGIQVERGNEIQTILDLTSREKVSIRKRGKEYALTCSWINRANEWNRLIFCNNVTNNPITDIPITDNPVTAYPVHDIRKIDVTFKYGTETTNIDITNIVIDKLIKDNHIFIQKNDDYRASIFTDPIFGVKKNIYITDNNNNILQEYSADEEVIYSLNFDFDTNCIKVINLKRRIDRKNDIINQLEKEEIKNYEIIEATDGEELNETQELYNLFEGNNFNNRKGVIGCALSHLKLWKKLSEDQNHDFYVILEDDLELSSNFKEKLKKHCSLFKKYNLEHLSLGVFDCNENEQKEIATQDIKVIKKDVYKFWNIAFAYIISKTAAIKILEFVNKCSIKCAIDNPRSYGDILTHFQTTHCIARQKNINHFGTDIQNNKTFSFNFSNKHNTVRIAFCDWWHIEYCGGVFDFNNNFLTNILQYSNIPKDNIIVVSPDENPDILFYSIFGSEHTKYKNVRKIFYSGEPFGPRSDANFNITFDKSSNNNYRYPIWLSYTNNYLLEECNRRKNGIINIPKRSKFCSFISNGECKTTCRREIVEKLSKYKRVDCGGAYLNNIGYTIPRGTNCSGKIEHNNNYKFAIAFENENYPGYVTEKICDIYKSNCVPIYWGNKEVLNDFNSKTFIYANNFTNFDELVKYIIKVDNDDELYASYFKEPFFSNKWLDIFNDPHRTFYKNLADCIIGKKINLYTNFYNNKDMINIYHNTLLKNLIDDNLTDKNTCHSYLDTYQTILQDKQFTAKNILEIGIQKGGSLKLWNDFFINAAIYGVDVDEAPTFLNSYKRINTIKNSAYTLDTYNNFIEKNIYFDVILDDGPHTIETMLFTLIHYSKLLAPNGIMIIEDIPSMDWALLFRKIVSDEHKMYTNIYDLRANKNRWDDIVFTLQNTTDTNGITIFDYSIYYGFNNLKEDITHCVLKYYLYKNEFEIPIGDDVRCQMFTNIDIFHGNIKNIYIHNNKLYNEIIVPHDQTYKLNIFEKLDRENKIPNIKIFNIWHNKLFDHCYSNLDENSLNKIIMYDVNPKYNKIYNTSKNYNILREYELEIYDKLLQETNYCQTSCLYHIFTNKYYKNIDYIGFIQYDMKLDKDFIYSMETKIKNSNNIIYFYSLTVENKINVTYICKPYNNSILEKYNNYFNTKHTYENIKNNEKSKYFICLHTFVIPVTTYVKMMEWYVSIKVWLHENYINNLYQESISEITEEIFGLFLLLQIIEDSTIELEMLKLHHEWPNLHNQTEWENYKVITPTNLKKIKKVFDIGANIGDWSISNVTKENIIISVEASTNIFNKLVNNVKSFDNIIPLNYAVCDSKEDYIEFYEAESDVLSSLNKEWIYGSKSRFNCNYKTTFSKTITLDKLIEQYGIPELIKIDVESAEYYCIKSLTKKVNNLCFEWASENLDMILNSLNYLFKLGFREFNIQMNSDDYNFVPNNYYSLSYIKQILLKTTPKYDWGMIHCR